VIQQSHYDHQRVNFKYWLVVSTQTSLNYDVPIAEWLWVTMKGYFSQ